MFHNVKTEDGTEIHSIPMEIVNGEWVDQNLHSLNASCWCKPPKYAGPTPTKWNILGESFDHHGEVYNHHRQSDIDSGTVRQAQ